MKLARAEIQLSKHRALINQFARDQMYNLSLPLNTPGHK